MKYLSFCILMLLLISQLMAMDRKQVNTAIEFAKTFAVKAGLDAVTQFGDKKLCSATSFRGYGRSDTTVLSAAMNSDADIVVIPNLGVSWEIEPVSIPSGKLLLLESGVVVEAKKGAYLKTHDSMFTIADDSNVGLIGYGAILRMRKSDYITSAYKKAEWRNCITITSSSHINIEGIAIEETGGDGIYIGLTKSRSQSIDISIVSVTINNSYRQGISVISARNLRIEECIILGTSGTSPEGGIDFEPNPGSIGLENCVVKNCKFERNRGGGILILIGKPIVNTNISISIEGCTFSGIFPSLRIRLRTPGLVGNIYVRECSFTGKRTVENLTATNISWE